MVCLGSGNSVAPTVRSLGNLNVSLCFLLAPVPWRRTHKYAEFGRNREDLRLEFSPHDERQHTTLRQPARLVCGLRFQFAEQAFQLLNK
jgi:hypothetical protein